MRWVEWSETAPWLLVPFLCQPLVWLRVSEQGLQSEAQSSWEPFASRALNWRSCLQAGHCPGERTQPGSEIVHITRATFQPAFVGLEREAGQGLNADLGDSVGKAPGPVLRLYISVEKQAMSIWPHFLIPNHAGNLKAEHGFKAWFDAYPCVWPVWYSKPSHHDCLAWMSPWFSL